MRIPFIAVAIAMASATAHAAITHVPPAEATAGTAIELVADAPPASATLVVHYRSHRKGATDPFTNLELVRKDGSQWVAVVPATAVTAPGLDYYITSGDQPV